MNNNAIHFLLRALAPQKCIKLLISTIFLLSIGMRSSSAFESSEHERMSNLALQVALGYFKKTHQEAIQDLTGGTSLLAVPGKYALDQHAPPPSNLNVSYGDIVACVDYFLYPEKIITDSWKWNRTAAYKDGLPIYDKGRPFIDVGLSCHSRSGVAGAQAAHNNHAHFQQDVIASFRLYHMAALASRTIHDNLYGALILNAVADHYLQDFFAPGHVITPRDSMSDVPATAMHDFGNENGLYFKPSRVDELIPVLSYICNQPRYRLEKGYCDLRKDEYLNQLVGVSDKTTLSPSAQATLSQAIHRIASPSPTRVHLLGDQRLWDRNDEQMTQRLLMLMIQVRSILDVLEARDSFSDVKWVSGTLEEVVPDPPFFLKGMLRSFAPEVAQISYGQYCLRKESCIDSDRRPRENGNASINMTLSSSNPDIKNIGQQDECCFGEFFPIYGLSLQRDSLAGGGREGRYAISLETLRRGLPVPGILKWGVPNLNIGGILGYTYYRDGRINGNGPLLRLVANVPETEYSIGPYIRWLSYPSRQGKQRHFSYGLRVDAGFSSYFTFFGGLGRDLGTAPTREVERGLLWSFGVEVAFPTSRFGRPRAASMEPINP